MTANETDKKFKIKHLPKLIVDTYKAWEADDPFRLSAIVAYYAVLSLPGLLVIIINLVGSVWGTDIVQGELTQEISSALGRDAAEAIQSMMIETQNEDRSTIASILGIGTLIFGATGVFYHLQLSLNQIWQVQPNPDIYVAFSRMLLFTSPISLILLFLWVLLPFFLP